MRRWFERTLASIRGGPAPLPPALGDHLDRSTELAEERTRLAIRRSYMAAERTLMAWIRTSLSMISFGFAIVKFFEQLAVDPHAGRAWEPATLGIALTTIGTGALLVAIFQYRHALGPYRARGLVPRWSLTLTVAALIALLGVYAFGTVLLHR